MRFLPCPRGAMPLPGKGKGDKKKDEEKTKVAFAYASKDEQLTKIKVTAQNIDPHAHLPPSPPPPHRRARTLTDVSAKQSRQERFGVVATSDKVEKLLNQEKKQLDNENKKKRAERFGIAGKQETCGIRTLRGGSGWLVGQIPSPPTHSLREAPATATTQGQIMARL